MPEAVLQANELTAGSRLDALRQQLQTANFQDHDRLRDFVNAYAVAQPSALADTAASRSDHVVADIRSELGLAPGASAAVTNVVSTHVKDLLLGRAQASEDTSHWGVHRGAHQVMLHSGQFTFEGEDIFIDGAGLDFRLRRVYKSQAFYRGPFGINWDHNHNLWLREIADGAVPQLVQMSGDLVEATFVEHPTLNYWVPPPGQHAVVFDLQHAIPADVLVVPLPTGAQQCRFLRREPSGTVTLYQPDPSAPDRHLLRYMLDRFGNSLVFDHEEGNAGTQRIARVLVNGPHRTVAFTYDSLDRIVQIQDHANRVWHYDYDDSGDLISATTPSTDRYASGMTERYRYSTPQTTGALQHNLLSVHDGASRRVVDNEYGSTYGLLSFNRVVRQREGRGERLFEYQDVSLATGPSGSTESHLQPAHQTTVMRRNGHLEHQIYNSVGNLLAREEDIWALGRRRRLVTHYGHNRDGAVIGHVSPEGRVAQTLFGRDVFVRRLHLQALTEADLQRHPSLGWKERLGFGNRLATVRRGHPLTAPVGFHFPNPLEQLGAISPAGDVVIKYTYAQHLDTIRSVSHPRYTTDPLPQATDENDQRYQAALTTFDYDTATGRLLDTIRFPARTRDGHQEHAPAEEAFVAYDSHSRPTEYRDRAGTIHTFDYLPPDDAREGFLHRQTIDPKGPNNTNGLDLTTRYEVDNLGNPTAITTPKGNVIEFEVDSLNRVTEATRTLPARVEQDAVTGTQRAKPAVKYSTRYAYCRNLRIDRTERDILDDEGNSLSGGVEVQTYAYDENDNLTRRTVGGSDSATHLATAYKYDDGDLLVETVLPEGNVVRVVYDDRRLPVTVTRGFGTPEAATMQITHDGDGLITRQIDGRGLRSEFRYDGLGRLIELRDYDDADDLFRIIRHDYDASDNLVNERLFVPAGGGQSLHHHVSMFYDEWDELIERRTRVFDTPVPYSQQQVDQRDDLVASAGAARTLLFRDSTGQVVRREQRGRRLRIDGTQEGADTILSWTYEYNAVGWPVAETDPVGNRIESDYDDHGMVTRIDQRDLVPTSATGEEVFTTRVEYDDLDRPMKMTDSLGNEVKFSYDSRDAMTRRVDPLDRVVRFSYDVVGRRTGECAERASSDGADIVTAYEYDRNGNLIRLIDGRGNATVDEFDALDRRTRRVFVDGAAERWSYDANDNLTTHRDPNGLVRNIRYGPLDLPIEMAVDDSELRPGLSFGGATREAFTYDAAGNMLKARAEITGAAWWHEIRFDCDSLGQIRTETSQFSDLANALHIHRAYDGFGFLRRLTYANGRVITFSPDGLNRVVAIDQRRAGVDYPGDGTLPAIRTLIENAYHGQRPASRRFGNGAALSWAYDRAGRLVEAKHIDAQQNVLLTLRQLADGVGAVCVSSAGTTSTALDRSEHYDYDARQQLVARHRGNTATAVTVAPLAPRQTPPAISSPLTGQDAIDALVAALAPLPPTDEWKYDDAGNRTTEQRWPGNLVTTAAADALNQIRSRDGITYTHDPSGNQIGENHTGGALQTLVYDHRHQLVDFAGTNQRVELRYDALGRLVWRSSTGIVEYLVYDDDNVIEEWRQVSGQPAKAHAHYVTETEPDSRRHLATAGTDLWYHTDLVGSTRALTGSDGLLAHDTGGNPAVYHYSAFGEFESGFDLPNPYLFAGARFDDIARGYHMRHRFYRPELGRFLQRDPLGYDDGTNLYTYAGNQPTSAHDPFGLSHETSVTDTFEAAIKKRSVPYAREVPIRVRVGSEWINGRADLIYKDPYTGRFHVVEFKGKSVAPSSFTPGQRSWIAALSEGAQWEVTGRPWVKPKSATAVQAGLQPGFTQSGGLFSLKPKSSGLSAVYVDNVFDAIKLVPTRQITVGGKPYRAIAPTVFRFRPPKLPSGVGGAAKGGAKSFVPFVVGLVAENTLQEKAAEDFYRRYSYSRTTLTELAAQYEAGIGFHFTGWQRDPLNPSREIAKWEFRPTGTHRLVMGIYYISNMFMAEHPVLHLIEKFPGYYLGKDHVYRPNSA